MMAAITCIRAMPDIKRWARRSTFRYLNDWGERGEDTRYSRSPGGGAFGLTRPPRWGGCQPSFDGPFWKNLASWLSGCPEAYLAFACPKIFPALSVSSWTFLIICW